MLVKAPTASEGRRKLHPDHVVVWKVAISLRSAVKHLDKLSVLVQTGPFLSGNEQSASGIATNLGLTALQHNAVTHPAE
jgi:hypothetical protein